MLRDEPSVVRPSRDAPDRVAGLVVALVAILDRRAHRPVGARPRGATGDLPGRDRRAAAFLGLDNPRSRVVCRPDSDDRIARMKAGALKQRNRELLRTCRFGSIQSAINTITRRNTSIYVLPGVYTEKKWASEERSEYCSNLKTDSNDPLDVVDYIGSVPDPQAERRRGVRPGRPVLLRPAALRPQPQPDRDLR